MYLHSARKHAHDWSGSATLSALEITDKYLVLNIGIEGDDTII